MKQTYLIGGNGNVSRNRNTRTRKRTRHTVWPFQRQTARYVKTLASRNSNWRTSVFGPVKARGGACLPPPSSISETKPAKKEEPGRVTMLWRHKMAAIALTHASCWHVRSVEASFDFQLDRTDIYFQQNHKLLFEKKINYI